MDSLSEQTPILGSVRAQVEMLRRAAPQLDSSQVRASLEPAFGDLAHLTEESIERIWADMGLPAEPKPLEERHMHGGAGLSFLAAAAEETGVMRDLADALLSGCPRLTVERDRDVLAGMLTALGAAHFLVRSPGFEGLDSPAGEWLGSLGGEAWPTARLEQLVSELEADHGGDLLWQACGEAARRLGSTWAGDGRPWSQSLVYVDATDNAYWTSDYATSPPRKGHVMPCLLRVTVDSGPGVPFLMEAHPGAGSASAQALRLLERVDTLIGEDQARRMTVLMDPARFPSYLSSFGSRRFVTLLDHETTSPGPEPGPWCRYRGKAELREGRRVLQGDGVPAGGLDLRAVEVRGSGDATPPAMILATNATTEELAASEVATLYFSRMPRHERLLRTGERVQGSTWVRHIALLSEASGSAPDRGGCNVVTPLAVAVFLLLEHVLREYLGGLHMELLTFKEMFLPVPVRLLSFEDRQAFRIGDVTRNPRSSAQLRQICAEITRRGLRLAGSARRMVFEVEDPPVERKRRGRPTR